jgi:multidrug efflux pump subunit AcrA (membrane-fusion protein)
VVATARAWPVEAQGHRVEPGVIVDEVLGVGVLESAREVRVAFEASGRVTALAVDEGALVALGDVLGTIDASDASRDLAVAESVARACRAATAARARSWSAPARGPAARRRSGPARTRSAAKGAIHAAEHEAALERDASAQAEVRAMKSALRQAESEPNSSRPARAGSVPRRSPTGGSRARSRAWSWPATWRRGSW